jgi:hypothetical protein
MTDTCENRQVEVGSRVSCTMHGDGGQRFTMRWFNRQRNGYRMACKPPECRQLDPLTGFQPSLGSPGHMAGCERTHGRVWAWPGRYWLVVTMLSARPAPAGRSRRNAVGRVGVKLGAAPDAPHWGKVLVRTSSDRFSGARMRAASEFTCPSREHPACPIITINVGGEVYGKPEPRPRWLASTGGGGQMGRTASWPEAGLRIARHPAWAWLPGRVGGECRHTTRQRASRDRTCGRDPHPGKDPL